jgi:hypothetical protein
MLARRIIGIVLCLIGVVWIGQGIGTIKGSFMTGQAFWAVMGGLALLFGITLLRSARRTG